MEDIHWRTALTKHSSIDVQNLDGFWIPARVVIEKGENLLIHYDEYWSLSCDENVARNSKRLAVYGSHKDDYRHPEPRAPEGSLRMDRDSNSVPMNMRNDETRGKCEDGGLKLNQETGELAAGIHSSSVSPSTSSSGLSSASSTGLSADGNPTKTKEQSTNESFSNIIIHLNTIRASIQRGKFDKHARTAWVALQQYGSTMCSGFVFHLQGYGKASLFAWVVLLRDTYDNTL